MTERIQAIEALIRQVEESADPATRAGVRELVQAILEYHGAGLERIAETRAARPLVRAVRARRPGRAACCCSTACIRRTSRPACSGPSTRSRMSSSPGISDYNVRVKLMPGGEISREALEQAIFAAAPETEHVEIEGLAAPPRSFPWRRSFELKMPVTAPRPFTTLRRFLPAKGAERCDLCGIALAPQRTLTCWSWDAPAGVLLRPLRDPLRASRRGDRIGEFRRRVRYDRRVPHVRRAVGQPADPDRPGVLRPYCTPQRRVLAFYPGPAGSTESLLSMETWTRSKRRIRRCATWSRMSRRCWSTASARRATTTSFPSTMLSPGRADPHALARALRRGRGVARYRPILRGIEGGRTCLT